YWQLSIDLDNDTAEAGFVGAAGDAVDPAVVTVVRLAGVGIGGDIAAIESSVRNRERTAVGGAGAAGAGLADAARIAGLRLQRGAANGTGVAHAVAASILRSASGRRSLPEIRRGSSVSRSSARRCACRAPAIRRAARGSRREIIASTTGTSATTTIRPANCFLLRLLNSAPSPAAFSIRARQPWTDCWVKPVDPDL